MHIMCIYLAWATPSDDSLQVSLQNQFGDLENREPDPDPQGPDLILVLVLLIYQLIYFVS